jgi:hypothetical protein
MRTADMSITRYRRLQQRVRDYVSIAVVEQDRLPTFSELTRLFHINMDDLEMLIDDTPGLSYNVGVRVGGNVGGMHGVFEHRGMYTVEYDREQTT